MPGHVSKAGNRIPCIIIILFFLNFYTLGYYYYCRRQFILLSKGNWIAVCGILWNSYKLNGASFPFVVRFTFTFKFNFWLLQCGMCRLQSRSYYRCETWRWKALYQEAEKLYERRGVFSVWGDEVVRLLISCWRGWSGKLTPAVWTWHYSRHKLCSWVIALFYFIYLFNTFGAPSTYKIQGKS